MRLTQIAILALRGSDRSVKQKIAEEIGVTEAAIYKFIQSNSDNLTKAAVIKIIREITGLEDSQILEETADHAA